MKNLLLFLMFSLSVVYTFAGGGGCTGQALSNPSNPAPSCATNPPAGNTCPLATPICDLNGYCGSTSSSYTVNTWTQLTNAFSNNCGGASIENNSFLKFTASGTTLSLNVWLTYTECGDGIQMMIFRATGCAGAVTNHGCWSPGTATAGPSVVTATGLTPGQEYYIMIDGFAGDNCNYVIGVNGANGGVAIPPSVSPQTSTICAGSSVNLTATGGNGGYTWVASPHLNTTTGANVVATPPGPGTYTYTVNSTVGNPNCPTGANSTATITVNSCVVPCTGIPPITGATSICAGTTTPFSTTMPTGGNITQVGNDRVHSFPSNGTFNATTGMTTRVLVVGGGGGGGANGGGGGGAGGLVHNASYIVGSGNTNVIVGAGGNGVGGGLAGAGGNSSFGGLTALGGGGGTSRDAGGAAMPGGSGGGGGGGAAPQLTGGAGTAGQGSNGANGFNNGCYSTGGGGGGAGGAGTAGASNVAGNGGAGVQNNITGTNLWYAGGGGGGTTNFTGCGGGTTWTNGTGGSGVGGNGENTAGAANTGGGGGAERNGGSGIVVVRYASYWTSSNTAVATVDNQGVVTGVSAGTATITYNIGGCSVTRDITIVAVPTVTAAPVSICSGTTATVPLTANPAGATLNWTVAQSGVTGGSNGSGSPISQVLTLTGATAGTATYTITPTMGTCTGTPVNVIVTVNPGPVATATPTAQTICSGATTGIALSSTPAGATFAWTAVQSGVSGASAGSGSSIAQVLTATGATAGTATYTITPTIGTCVGAPINVTITVNPSPVVTATPTAQTICSGETTGITLSSTPAGATFAWTVAQSGTSGASAGSGAAINQTLTATGAAAGTATYTITPTLGTCTGPPVNVVITVNPSPVVTATPAAQTICSGNTTGIALSSTPAGATFAWTVAQSGTSGASAGSGSSIAQVLATTGTTSGTATYTITPTIGTCVGAPIDVVITVNPAPVATATPTAQTICSGTSTGITLSSTPAGATFAWTAAQSGTSGASAGSGNSIAQVLTATGTTAGTATYTITPSIGTCSGTPIDVIITVNPTPVVTATPAAQTICSGQTTGIALSSTPAGATFNWTVAQSGTSGASAGSGSSIAQVLTATGATAGTATYTITPMLGTCPGTPIDVVITVSNNPVVTATPTAETICSGNTTGITLSSTPAGATFNWTIAQSGTSGASAGSGSSIAQVLTATGATAGTATYTITPSIGTCSGTPIDVIITVNPTPVVTATPIAQTICSGETTGIALSSTPAGATFDWTVTQSGTSGASAGSGSSIAQILTATGATAGTATYTITPMLGTCPGTPVDVIITVNPSPVVTATPASETICSGNATGITLSSVPAGATFAWTVAQSGTAGASNGSGSSIAQVLTTSGTTSGTATYTITPSIGTCIGTPIDVIITVNPTPVVTATPTAQTICSGETTGIAISSVPTGATFAWTVAQSGTAGASAGSGSSIAQVLTATGATAGTATYTITPTLGTCPGTPIDVVITVNPTPVVTATPASETICSGNATGITLSSVPAGATFAWTVTQTGTAGASDGSGTSITQVLTTSGTTSGTATYTITPTLGTCPGTPIDVVITVNPTPVITATPASETICSGNTTGITLSSVPTGATFAWTVAQSGTSGASAGTGASIAQTLTATGAIAGTATYTITPTLGTCPGTPIDVVVTVNPTPVVTATPASETICSGNATGITLSSVPAGATFAWTVAQSGTSGASAGSGSSIAQTLTATGTVAGTATYTITPTLGTCPGTPIDVVITVNPNPVVTATPAAQTICSGETTGIALTSVPAGATFAWTVVQSGVSGASGGTGNSIAQTLTATGITSGTATYTITPTLAGCPGLPIDVIITVGSNPVVTATPTAQTICSGETTGIALTSVPTGATYAWTVAQSGASGASAGSGNSIAQVLTATGLTTGTVTYTVTPTFGSCVGIPLDVVITVNPRPTAIATPTAQTICSGASTGIALTSSPAGATFAWTVAQNGASGATAGSGTSIAQVLSVTGLTSGTATYTITPTLGACPGTPIDVIITVNPTPTAIATPTAQTICSGTATGIALTSSPTGSTFAWTVAQSGTSGASAGSGSSIAQTLTATGTTAGTATYTITPTLGTCPGTPIDVVITVNPTPVVTATPTAQTICSGAATGIALTSTPAGSTFAWTVAQSGTSGASAGSGNSITQTLTATGTTAGTATYTITPTLGTCPGAPIDVVITVNPLPTAIATPTAQTICSGATTGIALTSTPAGSTFAWTVAQSGATGATAGSGSSIAQVLTASGLTAGTATYTITPTLAGCPGAPMDVVITVNPLPTVVATPTAQTLCSGETTGIALTSSPAGSTFAWTVAQSGASGASNGSGSSIAQVLTATGLTAGTVTYTITPTLAGCPGTPVDVVITVNPRPTAIATPTAQTICSGASTGIALTSSPAGATFAWTVAQSGTSGASAGSGSSIAQVLSVTGLTSGTATYTITPTLGACPGTPIDVVITVNPTPTAIATPTAQTICSGTATGIALTSSPTGSTFAWTVAQSGTSGASAGSGSSIAQTLTVTGTTAGTATYTITPTLGACAGTPIDVVITVNPTPTAIATPTAQTICSGATTGIALTSTPAGSTFAWTVAQSGATGATAGSGTSIAQVLTTTGAATGTATYTITPTLGTCPGAPIDVVITVNPLPTAIATPTAQTICSGATTGIALTSTPAGSTFAWTVAQSGATGATAGSGSSIAQVLSASGLTAGTATYTITPTLAGCPGAPMDVVITVNPLPTVVATPTSQTLCSGETTGIALTSSPAGSTFAWTVAQSGASGASNGSGSSIAQVLTATGLTAGTVTYTITPTLAGCPGTPVDVVITVNPRPTAIATPTLQAICSGATTGIALTSSPAGATFAWTVTQNGASGATAGSGTSIAQVLSVTGLTAGTATYTVTPTLGTCTGTPINVTITVNPTPTAIATPTAQTICSGAATGISLTSSPTGSTFVWTVAQTGTSGASNGTGTSIAQTLTATGTTQGTATYTITPTLGICTGTPITVPITVNPTPVATATPNAPAICSGASTAIALTSTPAGATFAWTVNQSGATGATAGSGTSITESLTASGAANGTVTYTVTPTLGTCVGAPINVAVTVRPLPTAIATPASQTICSGQTTGIALTSTPTGATYTWTTSQTSASGASNGTGSSIAQTLTATGATAGSVTYSVIPSLAGCTGPVKTVVITVNPNPTLVASPALASVCAGSSANLSVSGASTYTWAPATGLNVITGASVISTPAATQQYTVTGTDANGCVGITNVNVTVNPIPTTTVSPAVTICEGSSTTLTAGGATNYIWSPSQGLSSTSGTTVTASPGVTTTYTVTGSSNGCSSIATVTVTVNPAPFVSAGNDITVCEGQTAVLNGSGAVTYSWNNGVVDDVPFVASATNSYTVTGTGANGCTASDVVVVTVESLPIIAAVPDIAAGCVPVSIKFTNNSTGATSYSWDFGDGTSSSLANPSHSYLEAGCFDVTLTAITSGGCSTSLTYPSMVCVEPSPVAAFIASPASLPLDNPVSQMINLSENATSYSWNFGDGQGSSTQFAPAHTFPDDAVTNYMITLVAYSSTGCTDTARIRVEVYEDIVYYVPNSFTPDGDQYNPTFKPVFTSGYDPYDFTMLIYNRWGQVIFESHDASVGWSGTYGVGNEIVMDGTYVWTMEFKITQTGERKKINGHVNVLR